MARKFRKPLSASTVATLKRKAKRMKKLAQNLKKESFRSGSIKIGKELTLLAT